jgi:hypothetical protein
MNLKMGQAIIHLFMEMGSCVFTPFREVNHKGQNLCRIETTTTKKFSQMFLRM